MTDPAHSAQHTILFDGVCNLCNRSVQFVIDHDPRGRFLFASLQSDVAETLLKGRAIPAEDQDSVVYLRKGRILLRSAAALYILKDLGGWWGLLFAFIIVPAPFRDMVYRWVGRNRYRWFGKREQCMVPTPELRERFL
ncbi:MAG: thiol-disulfide oxidoreductase DCC family protein [Flavobacteriales bacterium]|nr:thiol-disulfide oxidoreductase DCC family protein [Flavobacteriales bacterium]